MKNVLYSLGVVIGQAFIFRSNDHYRGVAQLGRALGSGPRGRWFKSSHSDQPVVPAPKYRVSASEIRTSSHDDGVRIYFYSPQPAASCRSRFFYEHSYRIGSENCSRSLFLFVTAYSVSTSQSLQAPRLFRRRSCTDLLICAFQPVYS